MTSFMPDQNKNSGNKYLIRGMQTTGTPVQQSYPRWSAVFYWENHDPNALLFGLIKRQVHHMDRRNQQERSASIGRIHSIQITHHNRWSHQTERQDHLDRTESFQYFCNELHQTNQWWNEWEIEWDRWTLANQSYSKTLSSEFLSFHYPKIRIQVKSIRYQRWRKPSIKE